MYNIIVFLLSSLSLCVAASRQASDYHHYKVSTALFILHHFAFCRVCLSSDVFEYFRPRVLSLHFPHPEEMTPTRYQGDFEVC